MGLPGTGGTNILGEGRQAPHRTVEQSSTAAERSQSPLSSLASHAFHQLYSLEVLARVHMLGEVDESVARAGDVGVAVRGQGDGGLRWGDRHRGC